MEYKTASGITIIEGLEAIRRRPSMYIGPEEPGHTLHQRLLEFAVDGAAHDSGPGKEVRVFLWAGGDITVAYDGAPLPLEPSGRPVEGVLHPGLYQYFLDLFAGGEGFRRALAFGAIVNALTERLVVSTMHDGHRYRVVFSRGTVVTLLSRAECGSPLAVNWFTYRADPAIVTSTSLTVAQAEVVAERVSAGPSGARVRVDDRTGEEADWY